MMLILTWWLHVTSPFTGFFLRQVPFIQVLLIKVLLVEVLDHEMVPFCYIVH